MCLSTTEERRRVCVVLVCGNCGYTLLFNPKVLGLVEVRMVSDNASKKGGTCLDGVL